MKSLSEFIEQSSNISSLDVYIKEEKTYNIKPGTVIYFKFKSKDETIYKFTINDIKWSTYWATCYVDENDAGVKYFAINDTTVTGKDIHFVFTDCKSNDKDSGYASFEEAILKDSKNLNLSK